MYPTPEPTREYPISVDEVRAAYDKLGWDYTMGNHIDPDGVCPLTALWAVETRAFEPSTMERVLCGHFVERRGLSPDFLGGFVTGFEHGMLGDEDFEEGAELTDEFRLGMANGAEIRHEIHVLKRFVCMPIVS